MQSRLADDPSLLSLGNLVLKDKERSHPQAGRLDLLFQDADANKRFEVEIQLGRTDESHIIRTIEYWDIERKRYPQYEHTAVIVAEEVTARFLYVISLFNGHIPLVAIQMQAFRFGDNISLVFSKVLSEVRLGLVDEDEEAQDLTDRAYWEKRGSKASVELADSLLMLVRTVAPGLSLKYNKFYIGLASRLDNQITSSLSGLRRRASASSPGWNGLMSSRQSSSTQVSTSWSMTPAGDGTVSISARRM